MAHITHKKPSTLSTLWNCLTFGGNPTKVNCWFCNEDAYLLPGSKQTPFNWYCDLCKNINAKDQDGNIMDLSLEYSYHQPDISHCIRIKPRQPLRSLCDRCLENEENILRLVTDYIPAEDDPEYRHRYRTSEVYVASLREKYPLCRECQSKIDSLILEQKEAERSRNFLSRITNSLATKPSKRPSRLAYLIQGMFYIWTHIIAIYTLLYGYYYISTPTNWVQFNTMNEDFDYIFERLHTSWSIDKVPDILIEGLLFVCYTLYNTYMLAYKVIMHMLGSKKVMNTAGWELEDFTLEFYIANIISWFIIDWHPIVIRDFVEEPGRVKNWRLYKIVQRLLYISRIGNIYLINCAMEKSWMFAMTVFYVTCLLFSLLIVGTPKRKNSYKVPSLKPLGGTMKRVIYNFYVILVGKVKSMKKYLLSKKPEKEKTQQKTPQTQSMDVDDLSVMLEDQNESEEEVERVATKIDDIRL